jgi:hypothetical protein
VNAHGLIDSDIVVDKIITQQVKAQVHKQAETSSRMRATKNIRNKRPGEPATSLLESFENLLCGEKKRGALKCSASSKSVEPLKSLQNSIVRHDAA